MNQKIISLLAIKYNLDEEVIEKVIRSEFNFVSSSMEIGNFDSVHLHHLGKFCVKPKRLEDLNKRYE